MFRKLLITSFFLFASLITIYPSKKEKTKNFDFCYSLEKLISRNSVEKSNHLSKNFMPLAKDFTLFGTNKTKGSFANKIIDKYKTSKKSFFITFVPNQIYCLGGYWIEELNPGTLQSIFFDKSKERINQYKDIKKEINGFIKDINSEYKIIKKEIKDFF